jgi:hypothetical protein
MIQGDSVVPEFFEFKGPSGIISKIWMSRAVG